MSVDEFLNKEKFQLFRINLTSEELDQISLCRRGILGASGIGAIFGFFGGRIALGPVPSSIIIKSVVITASVLTGVIVGAGVSIQQSYNYLKSKPTNLATELRNFSKLKKSIYRCQNQQNLEFEDKLDGIFNKRTSRLPSSYSKE